MQQRTQSEEQDLEPSDFDARDSVPAPEEDDIEDDGGDDEVDGNGEDGDDGDETDDIDDV
jgi:hypothetical protein